MDACLAAAADTGLVAAAAIPRAAGVGTDPVLRPAGGGHGANPAARRRGAAAAARADDRRDRDLDSRCRGAGAAAMGRRPRDARDFRARSYPGDRYFRLDGAARFSYRRWLDAYAPRWRQARHQGLHRATAGRSP